MHKEQVVFRPATELSVLLAQCKTGGRAFKKLNNT